MLILPTADTGKNHAQELLKEAIDQRRKVTLIVFGDTPRAREVASRADVRADDHPARQVVWMPDPSVLQDRPEFARLEQLAEEGIDGAFFTLEFELSSRLAADDALRFSRLELGFARALAGEIA